MWPECPLRGLWVLNKIIINCNTLVCALFNKAENMFADTCSIKERMYDTRKPKVCRETMVPLSWPSESDLDKVHTVLRWRHILFSSLAGRSMPRCIDQLDRQVNFEARPMPSSNCIN